MAHHFSLLNALGKHCSWPDPVTLSFEKVSNAGSNSIQVLGQCRRRRTSLVKKAVPAVLQLAKLKPMQHIQWSSLMDSSIIVQSKS
jgi:hypothetical protein